MTLHFRGQLGTKNAITDTKTKKKDAKLGDKDRSSKRKAAHGG